MGFTASFLPKPRCGINGSGMHVNLSVSQGKKNLFHDPAGRDGLSEFGWAAIDRILDHGEELCLVLNASVNAYRRLDPHFEAPNQICASAVNRAAMVRIPIGNERSTRIEIRAVAPDANPYMAILALSRAAIETGTGPVAPGRGRDSRDRALPGSLQEAIAAFETGEWVRALLGPAVHRRYADLKNLVAARCPRELGTRIKTGEIRFHHEVTNQQLWAEF
jgi:glutamine synthetase